MALDIVDVPPLTDSEPDDIPEYACELCGTELFYSGRGRKPKRCTESNGGSDTCYKVSTPRGPRKSASPTVNQLVERIQEFQRMMGGAVMMLPLGENVKLDGMVLSNTADPCGESWRSLLESDRKVREMWEKFFTVSGWAGVFGTYLMMVGMPIMANHGWMGKVPVGVAPPPPPTVPDTEFTGFQPTQFDDGATS